MSENHRYFEDGTRWLEDGEMILQGDVWSSGKKARRRADRNGVGCSFRNGIDQGVKRSKKTDDAVTAGTYKEKEIFDVLFVGGPAHGIVHEFECHVPDVYYVPIRTNRETFIRIDERPPAYHPGVRITYRLHNENGVLVYRLQ